MGLKAKATKSEVPHSERVLARISQAQFDYGSAQERIAHGVMADEMKRNASDALRGRASADAAVADATFSDAMRLDTSAVVSADRYKADRAARIAEIGSGVSARTVESLGSVSRQANGYAMDKANLKLSDKIAARQALIDVGSAVATGYKSKQDNDKILSALSSSAGVPSSGVQMSPATNLYDINKHMRRGAIMQQYNMPYAMPENMHHSIAGMEAGSGAVANGFRARTRSIYDDPDQAAANLANQKRNNFLELYKPYMDDIAKQVNSRSIVNEGLAGIGSVNDRSAQKQRNAQRRNGASLTPAQKMLFEQTLSNSGVENSVTTANTVREQQRDSNLSVADTLMSLAQGQSSQGSAGLDNITSNAMARDANYRNQKSQAKQSNMAALASVASIAAMFMI